MTGQLKTLPLAKLHESAQAEFGPLFQWSAPLHYQHEAVEFEDLRDRAALMDFSWLTAIRVTGADRADYLNRRLSQKLDDIADGEGRRATLLDATGKMLCDLDVFGDGDTFFLIAPPYRGEGLAEELERYVFSEDVQFEDVSDELVVAGVIGPRAKDLFDAEGVTLPTEDKRLVVCDLHGLPNMRIARLSFAPWGWICLARDRAAHELMSWLVEAVGELDGHLAGWNAFNVLRIAEGLPWWGIDMDQNTVPLEADLFDAIHFEKGCYPGQETIAKITNLGHPARKIVRATARPDASLVAGSELKTADGKRAGIITSSTLPPGATQQALLLSVPWVQRNAGTKLVTAEGVEVEILGPCLSLGKEPAE